MNRLDNEMKMNADLWEEEQDQESGKMQAVLPEPPEHQRNACHFPQSIDDPYFRVVPTRRKAVKLSTIPLQNPGNMETEYLMLNMHNLAESAVKHGSWYSACALYSRLFNAFPDSWYYKFYQSMAWFHITIEPPERRTRRLMEDMQEVFAMVSKEYAQVPYMKTCCASLIFLDVIQASIESLSKASADLIRHPAQMERYVDLFSSTYCSLELMEFSLQILKDPCFTMEQSRPISLEIMGFFTDASHFYQRFIPFLQNFIMEPEELEKELERDIDTERFSVSADPSHPASDAAGADVGHPLDSKEPNAGANEEANSGASLERRREKEKLLQNQREAAMVVQNSIMDMNNMLEEIIERDRELEERILASHITFGA